MARFGQIPQNLVKILTMALVLLACFFLAKAIMIWMNPQSAWIAPPAAATSVSNPGQNKNSPKLDYNFDPFHRDYVPNEEIPLDINPDEDVADTSLNLKLTGTTVPDSAIIEGSDRNQNSYGLGDEISNGVTLESVHHGYVILSRDGNREKLSLERQESGLGSGAEVTPSSARTNVRRAASAAGIAGVNPADLLRQISVTPHKEGGQMIGYRLQSRPGFDLKPLGFRDGDVVTRVGSQNLNKEGLDLGSTVISAVAEGNPTAQIMRRGRRMTIRIRTP